MKKAIYSIICLWVLITAIIVLKQEYTLTKGVEVLLETFPVDPKDIFRGDYVILNYKIARIYNYSYDFKPNDTVYGILQVDNKKKADLYYYTPYRPERGLYLKGKVDYNSHVNFGIESYFTKENEARILEDKIRQGALVRVKIDRYGQAKVVGFTDKIND